MRSLVSWVAQRRPDAQTAPSARWLVFGHSVTWGEDSHGQAGSSGFSGLSRSANLGQSSRGPQVGGNGGGRGGFVSLLYVPGCGRPPLSVSSAVCPAAPGALRGGSPVSRSRIRPPNLSLSLWPSGAPPPECCLHPSVSVQWVGHSRPRHLPDSHGRSRGVHTKCSGFCIRTF